MRLHRLAVLLFAVLIASGCQTMNQPASESIDRAMTAPAPATPPQEASQNEPRPGFDQETTKAQTP